MPSISQVGARNTGRPKMAVLLAEAITEDLVSGGVKPGTMLAPEAQMMRQYDVGRATVREAMRLLEARGLLEVRPGRSGGPIVRDLDSSQLTHALALLLRVSEASVKEVVESREVIEPALAARAARHRTEQDIAELVRIQALVAASVDDDEAFSTHNREWHSRIARASANEPMHLFWQAISYIADGHVAGVRYSRSDRQAAVRIHERIMAAIVAGDADAAADLMSRHLGAMHAYMTRHYPAVLRRGVALPLGERSL